MNLSQQQIDNATYEAIFWWNRDESFYHRYFSQIVEIYADKELLKFFTVKIFEVFLREYSIRRNLSSGYESIDMFIVELFENKFVDNVIDGNTDIIDKVSNKLKVDEKSTKRQTRSLLSKVAFLVNPHDFSLYDNLAKQSLWNLKKASKKFKFNDIENYSGFLKQTDLLLSELRTNNLFENCQNILEHFKTTPAYSFFKNRQATFERRITDKSLWLLGQKSGSRQYDHKQYIKLNKM